MDLDDQLAALAAGELDDDTTRALRARVASDPALARRLARLEQLERLLRSWDPPAMTPEAASRLEARVEAALDELDDTPLATQAAATTPLPAVAATGDGDGPDASTAAGAAGGDHTDHTDHTDRTVVDLGAARQRWGLPNWASGLAIAAALVAVVGTGIVLGGLPGGSDLDTLAESSDDAGDDAAERAEEESAPADSAAITSENGDDTATSDTALSSGSSAPQRLRGVDLARGELLQLADEPLQSDQDTAADEPAAGDGEADDTGVATCIEEALQRDTDTDGDAQLQLLADGTYDGREAVFVVLRTATASGERIQVLAYDPADCSLLDAAETSR